MGTLSQVIEGMEQVISEVSAAIAKNVTDEIRNNTPVKTGFCKSNWVPSVGSPFEGLAGSKISSDNAIIDDGPYRDGLSQLEGYNISQGDIFIVNNTDYVQVLDAGSSSQAPSGFVNTAIDVGIMNTGS